MVCDSRIGSIFEYIKSNSSRSFFACLDRYSFPYSKSKVQDFTFFIKFGAYFVALFAAKLRFHLVYSYRPPGLLERLLFAYTVKKG